MEVEAEAGGALPGLSPQHAGTHAGSASPGFGPLPQRQVKERTTQPSRRARPVGEALGRTDVGGLRGNGSLFSARGKSATEGDLPDVSGSFLPCWLEATISAWASGPAEADSCWLSTCRAPSGVGGSGSGRSELGYGRRESHGDLTSLCRFENAPLETRLPRVRLRPRSRGKRRRGE